MEESVLKDFDRVAHLLEAANDILVVTGAGISADSGLPTYRGVAGLYEVQDTPDGMPIEEILSPRTLRADPELVWKYLGEVGRAAVGARPNRAHEVIAAMESVFRRVIVLTQNVDDLHARAGSTNVLEIHGNMHDMFCDSCGHGFRVEDFRTLEIPPMCERCDEVMRPRVVLFGELLPQDVLRRLYDETERGFDCVFSIGTSSLFPYIAAPVLQAARAGVPTIEINPGVSEVSSRVMVRLPIGAARGMDEIWTRYIANNRPRAT